MPLTNLEGGTSPFDFLLLRSEVKQTTPITTFQYIEVTFSTANADFDIKHDLRPDNNENVYYYVVRADRATSIYHDQSGTRKAWGDGYIILRSSTASAKVTLLLFTPRSV